MTFVSAKGRPLGVARNYVFSMESAGDAQRAATIEDERRHGAVKTGVLYRVWDESGVLVIDDHAGSTV